MKNMIVMGAYSLLLFGDLPKCYGTLKFLLIQDHMRLEMSKRYSSYRFHLMLVKLYEDIGYHGGFAYYFSWQSAIFF